MAAEDSNRVAFEKELDGTLSCCICTEFYTEPKALPCIHTFCMKCLQKVGFTANKGPGDEMPCPICRGQFKIPQEGFSGLPNNFLIAKLIQAANVSNPSESSRDICDICLEDNKETEKEILKANMYCTDCKQKLCDECCGQHRKFKLNKNHKLLPLNEQQVSDENKIANLTPSACELHEQRVLEIYCAECKTVECAVCFIDSHMHHKGSHVSKFVDGFRKQIESNIETINKCSSQTQMKKAELNEIKEDIQQKVERLEEDVMKRRDEVKQLADSQANSLLQSLSSLRQSKLKELQMEADDIDAHLSCLQSYSSYCEKMISKGSDSDICRAVLDLSVKAGNLKEQCQSLNEREIQFFKVSFTKSEIKECLEDDNLIGEIEDDGNATQRKTSTSKVAVIKKQSDEIDRLKEDINLERIEKETFRLENEQLKMSVDSEKTINKTLQGDNDKLRQKLETQRKAVEDLVKAKEQANEDLENTTKDLRAKILDFEQKREDETKTSTEEKQQLISQIQEHNRLMDKLRSEYRLDATLVQTIRTKAAEEKKKSIQGLTILDNELFVLSEKSSDVEVYDSMTLGFSRQWNLKELIQPQDIVSCARNKCLYIFDHKGIWKSNEIFRVDPNGKLIQTWSTGSNSGYSLSVTFESNVILPVYNANKLVEYSPDGQLIRELIILSGHLFGEIWHAIKLANGHFVISLRSASLFPDQRPRSHGMCIVDENGNLRKSFGGKPGSTSGQLNVPMHFSVDGNGFVMVANRENSRVLLLDSNLEFKRKILSKEEKHGLRRPTRILLDALNERLFVADNESNNQRILIFDLKIFC